MGTTAKKPEHIGAILETLYKQLGLTDGIKQQQALNSWSVVVGKTMANATSPVRIEHGRLFVQVENPVWRQEIIFYKQKIITKLNKKIGKDIIKDIIFI